MTGASGAVVISFPMRSASLRFSGIALVQRVCQAGGQAPGADEAAEKFGVMRIYARSTGKMTSSADGAKMLLTQ